MAICFDAIGEKYVTFLASEGTEQGTGGYVELPYTGTAPAVGYALLAADGKGGVRTAASGGRSCLVVHVDTAEKKIGLFL